MSAAFVAGVLVVGGAGRLVMRVLAVTSGAVVQGTTTEAEATVGEISVGGTLSFVIFAGMLLPVFASFLYLLLRRILPHTAGLAGLVFGILLLGTFGVDDPLSPGNVDFVLLSPVSLAVVLVSATALLYGLTFSALAARFDAVSPSISDLRDRARAGPTTAIYASLVLLVIPFFTLPAAVYVGARALARGRVLALLGRRFVRVGASVALGVATTVAAAATISAATDILA